MKKTIAIIGAVLLAFILNSEILGLALLTAGGVWLVCKLFKEMAEHGY